MCISVKMIVCIFLLSFPYFPNISQHFQSILIIVIFSFHSRSRSRPFPGIIASDSRSRILGMDFFIPFPFPKFGNGLFQFPSRSRTLGMEFSIPVPVPEPSKVIPAHPWIWVMRAVMRAKCPIWMRLAEISVTMKYLSCINFLLIGDFSVVPLL